MNALRSRLQTVALLDILLAGFVLFLVVFTLFLHPWDERGKELIQLNDLGHHLFRVADTAELFDHGNFFADLSPNAAKQKGLPLYIYYSQWVYLIPYLFLKLGFSLLVALKLAVCVLIILTSISFFHFLRLHAPPHLAKAGTLLYLTANYVLGDVFVRFAYSEFASYALLPLLLYTSHRAVVEKSRLFTLYSILVTASMILFHPLSLMNSVIAILVYLLFVLPGGKLWEGGLRLGASYAAAFAVTMFFWFPSVMEREHVFGIARLPVGYPFLESADYFQPFIFKNLGVVLTWLFVGSVVLTIYRATVRGDTSEKRRFWLLGGSLLYLFLTHIVSTPLWEYSSTLRSNAWSWRFLFPLAVIATLYVVLSVGPILDRLSDARTVLALSSGLLIVQGFLFLNERPGLTFTPTKIKDDLLDGYISFYSGQVKGWGISEYTPNRLTMTNVLKEPGCTQQINRRIYRKEGNNHIINIPSDPGDCFLHLPFFWNVRFKAVVDDVETDIFSTERGEMLIPLRSGNRQVSVLFTKPWYVQMSRAVSAVVALILLGWAVVLARQAHGNPEAAT